MNVRLEHRTGVYVATTQGPKEFVADVYFESLKLLEMHSHPLAYFGEGVTRKCILEIDGKHHTKRKNDYRDKVLAEAGIKTVRLPLAWFKRGETTDADLIAHIEYSLR